MFLKRLFLQHGELKINFTVIVIPTQMSSLVVLFFTDCATNNMQILKWKIEVYTF